MTEEEQVEIRNDMAVAILDAIDLHQPEIGNRLISSDVIGVLESVKMKVFQDSINT